MIGNLFLKVLTVAAPTVASLVAFDPTTTLTDVSVPSNLAVVEVKAEAPYAIGGNFFDSAKVPTVPIVVTSENADGAQDSMNLNIPLRGDLVATIKGSFKENANAVLRSVESALEEGAKSSDPMVRDAAITMLPAVQDAVPYRVNEGIKIPTKIEARVAQIAEKTYQATGKRIVVTSAARSAESQASAMKTKLDLGESPRRLYANKKAAGEIESAYYWARKSGLSGDQIVSTMASVVQRQIDSGVYISRHLKEGAVDLRSRDLSGYERTVVRQAAQELGAKVLLESTPPHFHLELF